MGYQSLPWQAGDSHSFGKLVALHLPSLEGRSLLDVGCNTGYFCGWAVFDKSVRVMGIDRNTQAIEMAKSWFKGCSFLCMSWEDLPPDQFDVVLCLSAIHYAEDQKALIDTLMQRVAPGGMLVLELGIAPGEEDTFETVQRSIDTRQFPTRKKLHSMLSNYVFKAIASSVQQVGDPIPRSVYHIRHKLPVAVLLMDEHYSGKSSLAEAVIKPDLTYIRGDGVYSNIRSGKIHVTDTLREIIQPEPLSNQLNSAAITSEICKAGLLAELIDLYISLAAGHSVVIDNYIPEAFRNSACEAFEAAGFFVAAMSIWQNDEKYWIRRRSPRSLYKTYSRYLEKMGLIDEAAYLEANPDVARAVAEKKMPNGQYHYYNFGRHEGRKLRK